MTISFNTTHCVCTLRVFLNETVINMWKLFGSLQLSWQIILLLMIVLLSLTYFVLSSPWKRLPPGPPSFPLIGSLPFLRGDIRKVFSNMAIKYGSIFTVYFGPKRIVVINGYDVIKECLLKSGGIFDNRSNFWESFNSNLGVASSNGNFWKEQRHYMQHFLHTFGQGNTSMEDVVNSEASYLVVALATKMGNPCHVDNELTIAIANVISILLMDRRFDYDDNEIKDFLKTIDVAVGALGPGNLAIHFPLLRYVPGDPFNYHKGAYYVNEQLQIAQSWIENYKEKKVHSSSALISQYLREINSRQNEKETSFSEAQLRALLCETYGAGVDTTTYTLLWAILYMVLNPVMQQKVQTEIDLVIGSDRQPVMQDRRNMDYTQAVLCEVNRLGDLLPLGVPRSTAESTVIRGYEIPKDTMVIVNLNSVFRDPNLWPQPEIFNPGRFLDEDGKFRKQNELIAFSIGKRSCMGENLARMQMFLFFTNLLQKFTFNVPENQPKPSTNGVLGLSNRTEQFTVDIKLR